MLLKGLDEIIGDPVVEVSHTNMLIMVKEQGNRLNVGAVKARNERRTGGSHVFVSTYLSDHILNLGKGDHYKEQTKRYNKCYDEDSYAKGNRSNQQG
jgi:hypothetical protein